jgi:hypothetical protein
MKLCSNTCKANDNLVKNKPGLFLPSRQRGRDYFSKKRGGGRAGRGISRNFGGVKRNQLAIT